MIESNKSAGKEKEFEEYFNKYYNQAFGYVFKKVNNVHTAEDLTMDAFASCFQNFSRFDPGKASFATWLYVIIDNKIKNYYRGNRLFIELNENTIQKDDTQSEIEEAVHLDFLRGHLAEALNELNEVQRQIVIYKYFENKNSAEISSVIGISQTYARVQLSRALKKLKEYFEKNNIRWE